MGGELDVIETVEHPRSFASLFTSLDGVVIGNRQLSAVSEPSVLWLKLRGLDHEAEGIPLK